MNGSYQLKELTPRLRISFTLTPPQSRKRHAVQIGALVRPFKANVGRKYYVVGLLLMGWTGADSLNEADKEAHVRDVSLFLFPFNGGVHHRGRTADVLPVHSLCMRK